MRIKVIKYIEKFGKIRIRYYICKFRSRNHYCEDFTVFIDGPPIIEAGKIYEWCANSSGCESNMTNLWEYSVDGFNWVNGGNEECFKLQANNTHLHVRLKIICDNGCFNIGYLFSINKNGLFNENCLEGRLSTNSEMNKSLISLTSSPNVTSNNINVNFDFRNAKNDIYNLKIHNAFGLSVNLGFFSKSDNHLHSIDVSNYKNGIYFITLESKNEYAISKFVVQH